VHVASIDGAIAPAAESRIAVTDDGLLRGDGAFEVIRLYEGRPFALEDHFERLARTCAGLFLEADLDLLRAEVAALLEAAAPGDALLRLVLTRGGRRIAIIEPLPPRTAIARVATVAFQPGRVLDGLKTLSYAGNMLAARRAGRAGFDEALLVTPEGRVLEGQTWAFFWVSRGALYTPPLADGILASITRACVMDELDTVETPISLHELANVEEAFIASTVREVTPISHVDDLALPAAPGPLTLRAASLLQRRIARALAGDEPAGCAVPTRG
jgi:branched-chain amino acid aminotransferase